MTAFEAVARAYRENRYLSGHWEVYQDESIVSQLAGVAMHILRDAGGEASLDELKVLARAELSR